MRRACRSPGRRRRTPAGSGRWVKTSPSHQRQRRSTRGERQQQSGVLFASGTSVIETYPKREATERRDNGATCGARPVRRSYPLYITRLDKRGGLASSQALDDEEIRQALAVAEDER